MKKILSLTTALFLVLNLVGQELDVKWSEKFMYDNKIDGFFRTYVGANSSFVYAKLNKLGYGGSYSNSKLKLLAFDKNTMAKKGEADLMGPLEKKEKSNLDYYQTIVLQNLIYVLWTKDEDGVIEVYAETFDNKLKRINHLKKIYEINSGKKATDNLLILYNDKIGNKILLGREFATTKDNENLRIEYKLINEDFSLVSSNQVSLPIVITKKKKRDNSAELICTYELANDGYLYIKDAVKVSDEVKKTLKKGEASVYPVLMQVNLESGNIKYFNLKFKNKNTFKFSWVVTRDNVRMYGFFSDLEKDTKGRDTHGMFYMSVSSDNFKDVEPKFSYFDTDFLNKLYANDKEDQKSGGIFQSKKAKESDEESIDDNYIIEGVVAENKNTILFCTIMRNWSRTVCTTNSNGSQSCHTYYYCTKRNVTAFKFNDNGEMIWANNMDRLITYSGWDVLDLSVISSDNNHFIVYGSDYDNTNTDGKKTKASKKARKVLKPFQYVVFDGKTGDFKKRDYAVNKLSTKSADVKSISAANIWVFDNKMYTEFSNYKYKPSIWFSCLCPPLYAIFTRSGNFKQGTGFLGTINPSN